MCGESVNAACVGADNMTFGGGGGCGGGVVFACVHACAIGLWLRSG